MSENRYDLLRVWLDTEGNDIYSNTYNNSYSLWEYIKKEISNPNDRNKLGLYGPDYHALTINDAENGRYIQTYTLGDLLNFLNYNYHYNSLQDASQPSKKIKVHRRLTIVPIPIDRLDNVTRHYQEDSKKQNSKQDYVWRVSIGGDVLGENVELVYALYDAVKEVYLNRKLYKIALQDSINCNVPSLNMTETSTNEQEKRFLYINKSLDIFNNDVSELGIYEPRLRAQTLKNGNDGSYYKVYDIGDLISFLRYNYYQNITFKDKEVIYNKRLLIAPEPIYDYSINNIVPDNDNNRLTYNWVIKIDGDIIGKSTHLIDALVQAINTIYNNTELYKTILTEIRDSQIEYEEQKEFSLRDV